MAKGTKSIVIAMALLLALPATAATREEKRVADATDVIDQLLRIPEQSVPPSLLSRAYAIAVIPDVVKVGFGLGARRGRGIVVVRRDDGSWSNPVFLTLTGGSIGWQIGAQSSDIILVFKTRRGVDGISSGKFTLGADASVAAGPVGRHTAVATDIEFEAEVYSYSRSRGLFVGVALEGAGVTMDKKANAAFYGSATLTPQQIFDSEGNMAPAVANNFVQVLSAQTQRLPKQPGIDDAATGTTGATTDSTNQPSVRTFGIGDPDSESTDDGHLQEFQD
jgi:lipid-binding SYLF domain-containing protein